MEITGLIPAGGLAERLGKLPYSKEVLPYKDDSGKMRVISENLINYFRLAGIKNIYFIIRKGKWDIPEYFGDGSAYGVNIGYLTMKLPYGTPFTLSQAFPFVKDKIVALGFPDIIFKVLKYLARNVHDADSNLYLANLITSDEIIKAIYDTFTLFKNDIMDPDRDKRILNVKRIQQFPPGTEHKFSSPLDAAARFKYVLEFIALKRNEDHIYKKSDLSLTGID